MKVEPLSSWYAHFLKPPEHRARPSTFNGTHDRRSTLARLDGTPAIDIEHRGPLGECRHDRRKSPEEQEACARQD